MLTLSCAFGRICMGKKSQFEHLIRAWFLLTLNLYRHITVIYLIFMHICCTHVTLTMSYAYMSMPAGALGRILEVQSMVGHGEGCKAAYDGAAECCSEPDLC